MNPTDLQHWLERHNLNPGQAAQYLGTDRKTIDRYLKGDLDIPTRVAVATAALDPLRIYKLTPRDAEHNDWRASSHKGEVFVRAQSPYLARWHAAKTFHVAARRREGDTESPSNPWLSKERVKVEVLYGLKGAHKHEGQPGVVEPSADGGDDGD